MGYNNNNAGMHLMRWIDRSMRNDLKRYDEIASRPKPIKKEEKPTIEEILTPVTITTTKKKVEEIDIKTVQPQIDTKPISNNKSKRKHKSKDNESPVYGTEMVIDWKHFEIYHAIMANIMIIAIQHKKDILKILLECEKLMQLDKRTNASPESDWNCMYDSERVFIFLSMVADKLECNISDLFIDDPNSRKEFIYNLLDYIKQNEFIEYFIYDGEINEANSGSFKIDNFDRIYEMSKIIQHYHHQSMGLNFEKSIYKDEGAVYTISFGSLLIFPDISPKEYCGKGAYLYEETSGILKDYIEEMFAKHPEWRNV